MGNAANWFTFLSLVITGVYVLPSVVATFSGSHSMEVNTTNTLDDNPDFYKANVCFPYCHESYKILENIPRCTACHEYILNELNATANSRSVLASHTPPSQQSLGSPDSDVVYACVMCHHPPKINLAGTHTKLTIVACTYCHGNSTDPGIFKYAVPGDHPSYAANDTAWVGPQLATSNDAHSNWFKEMEKSDSSYPIAGQNRNFTSGFYSCLACHTHLEMNMKLTRPRAFNVNITINGTGVTIDGPAINYSVEDTIYAQRPKGSVWR